MSHGVADVGQTEQHQRDTKDRVEYRDHFAPLSFRCYVAVPCALIYNNYTLLNQFGGIE